MCLFDALKVALVASNYKAKNGFEIRQEVIATSLWPCWYWLNPLKTIYLRKTKPRNGGRHLRLCLLATYFH